MTIIIGFILAMALFAGAAFPLLRKKSAYSTINTGEDNLEELRSHRDTTYSMLKELDFDFQSGILSSDDYGSLRDRYKRKAVSILKDIDTLEEDPGSMDEIEKKVLALRRKEGQVREDTHVDDEIERRVMALRGQVAAPSDSVKGEERFCRQCGASHRQVDRFCGQCGMKLVTEGE